MHLAALLATGPGPLDVRIEGAEGRAQLMVNGRPFVVKGAGASLEMLDELAAAGANTVRTWGVGEDTAAYLDRAHELGLKVVLGIWLRKEEDGFRYDKPADRVSQYLHALDAVQRFRHHPALLMWAVGNEMELGAPDERVWVDVENITRIFKRWDPGRPVMTVVADMWPEKMDAILRRSPSLDLLGINSYDGLPSLHQRMTRWTKPYLVTEYHFSNPAPIETGFSARLEPDSTTKARSLERNHLRDVMGRPGRSLGGFFFHWSPSTTQTASVHSPFLRTGEKLEAVDVLTRLWGGSKPDNAAPTLASATTQDSGRTWKVAMTDPDRDPVVMNWEVISEEHSRRFVGDFEQKMPIVRTGTTSGEVKLPADLADGSHRIFVIGRDGRGGAAVWNAPYLVRSGRIIRVGMWPQSPMPVEQS